MADNLFAKVREEGRSIRTLTVKVRYNDMGEDQCSESLPEPTDLETDVYGRLHNLLRAAWKRRVSLRLVSLKLSNVYDGRFRSELALEVSAQRQDAQERLAAAVDELRKARGHSVILRGHDLRLRDAPREVVAREVAKIIPPVSHRGNLRRLPRRRQLRSVAGAQSLFVSGFHAFPGGDCGTGEAARTARRCAHGHRQLAWRG